MPSPGQLSQSRPQALGSGLAPAAGSAGAQTRPRPAEALPAASTVSSLSTARAAGFSWLHNRSIPEPELSMALWSPLCIWGSKHDIKMQ